MSNLLLVLHTYRRISTPKANKTTHTHKFHSLLLSGVLTNSIELDRKTRSCPDNGVFRFSAANVSSSSSISIRNLCTKRHQPNMGHAHKTLKQVSVFTQNKIHIPILLFFFRTKFTNVSRFIKRTISCLVQRIPEMTSLCVCVCVCERQWL